MSRSTAFGAVLVAALSSSAVFAQSETKLAYVDLQRALVEVDEGRQAKDRLQAMLQNKQKEIDKEQEALRKESEQLQKQASAMSEDTLRQKQIEMQKKLMELSQKWEKGRAEMQQTEARELNVIFGKMTAIIEQIAKREGFTMVLEKGDSGLVYAPPSLDVTNELVRIYNSQHKVASAKKAAPKSDAPKK